MHLKLMDGKRKVSAWDAKRYTVTNHLDGTLEIEMGVYETGAYRLETVRLPDDGDVLYVQDGATGRTVDTYRWPTTTAEDGDDDAPPSQPETQPEIRKEFRTI